MAEQTQTETQTQDVPLVSEEDANNLELKPESTPEVKPEVQEESKPNPMAELEEKVKQYEQKLQGFEDLKTKANNLDMLVRNPNFQKWYQEQSNPKKEEVVQSLTDEQYTALISNKDAFSKYVSDVAAKQANNLLAPQIAEARTQVEVMKRQMEIERFAGDNPDFWDLDKAGLIEPILRQYPNLSIADVYKLASKETIEGKAVQRAHNLVSTKKRAIVEKPTGVTRSSSKVTAQTREEYMQRVWEAAKNGREIPEWDK